MAFDIRCPECKAKLRLDEAPDPDTPIECPRCGSQFSAAPPADAAARKPARDAAPKKPKGGAPKKKKAKRKKTNPVFLLIAIAFGFGGLIVVGFLMMWILNRAGKVEEMLACVPENCNWARGVNVSQLSKYPGYAQEVDKFYTGGVKSAAQEVAKAAGHDPDTFTDYLVIAKNRGDRSTATMYVFRSAKSFDPAATGKGLPGATDAGDGAYKMPANGAGVLRGATVVLPTPRLVVVIPPGATQAEMVKTAQGAKTDARDGTFAGKLDATSRTVVRGSIWLVVRATGGLKTFISGTTGVVAPDLKPLHDQGSKSPTFGVWSTPGGGGVRVGAALQCQSAEDASALVKSMKEGPLGQGDASEPPNSLKSGFSLSSDKKTFGEFMQYMSFRSTKECAYLVSNMTGENSKRGMDLFNSPSMASDESGSGGGGGGGFGGGGPGGGPGERGLPGGIAPPGLAGPGGR